jgi:nucleotide-binding universal stress UspA family protein
VEAALASLPSGVEAADELLEGDVVEELAALDDHECDLLVCGSRGYGPVRRVLLGGVSRQLVRRAACPVVIVPR